MKPKRKKAAGGVCLCGECGGKPHIRGLSRSCYQAALRRVRSGVVTWAELEASGHTLPAIPHAKRRHATNPMSRVIDAMSR